MEKRRVLEELVRLVDSDLNIEARTLQGERLCEAATSHLMKYVCLPIVGKMLDEGRLRKVQTTVYSEPWATLTTNDVIYSGDQHIIVVYEIPDMEHRDVQWDTRYVVDPTIGQFNQLKSMVTTTRVFEDNEYPWRYIRK